MLLISACLHKVLDRAYPSLFALPTGGVEDCQPQIALCQRLAASWGWIVFTNTDTVSFETIFHLYINSQSGNLQELASSLGAGGWPSVPYNRFGNSFTPYL